MSVRLYKDEMKIFSMENPYKVVCLFLSAKLNKSRGLKIYAKRVEFEFYKFFSLSITLLSFCSFA
jgi:hypothetical protein